MPPAAGGERIDALYWELELRSQGVEAGAAKTKAVLKEIDLAAERTKRNLNDIGGSSTDYQRKQQAIGDLNKTFAAGLISEAQYVEQSKALGVNLKTLTPAASAAAAAFVAQGAAATGAAVATEAVSVATKGLLRTLGPFLVAMIGIELGAKLVRIVWQALTGTAGELKKKVDELTDSLLKQKQAAFDATLEGQRAISASALGAELAAQAKVDEIGPRTFANRTIFARAQAELAKATQAQIQAQAAVTETLERNAEREATSLGRVLSAGIATNVMRGKANILVAEYNRQINELLSSGRTDAATVDQINRLQGMVDALTAADKKAEKTAERAESAAQRLRDEQARARAGFAAAIAAKTPGTEDDLEAQIARLVQAARNAKIGTAEIQKMVADLRRVTAESLKREGDALAEQLRTQLVATTVTAVDDLTEALHRFDVQIEAARRKGTPIDENLVTQLREAKVAAIEVTKEVEALNGRLEFYDRQRAQSRNDIRFISELNFEKSRLELQLKSVKNEDDRRRILKEIEEIEKRIEAAIRGQKDHVTEMESKTARIAGNIAAIANVAYGLAVAFAGANSELAKMIGAIGQIAGGIQTIANAKNLIQALPGIGQVLGGGIVLAQTLFGESEAERARAQRTKENTEALRALTNRVGNIGKIDVTGGDFARLTALLNDPAFRRAATIPPGVRPFAGGGDDIDAALARFGFSAAEFAALARQFGIAVDAARISLKDIQQVQDAIKAAELTTFADTFSGQMQEFAAEAKLFDLTKPTDQLAAFRRALDRIKDGGGILSKVLADFDLETAEGVEAAKKALQDLFVQFQNLQPGDIPSFLGGLSPQEFLDAIERWKDILNAATGGAAGSGTGGFNVETKITEVTGSRMAALLTTGNVFAEQTAQNTAAIRQLLSGGIPTPLISPPSISPFSGPPVNSVSSSISFAPGAIQVTISGPIEDPQTTGVVIGENIVREIDRRLGSRAQWARRAAGDIRLTS